LLGLLNSSLFWFYFKNKLTVLGDPEKGGRLRFFTQFVVDIPIKTNKIEPDRKKRSNVHKNIENLQENIETLAIEMIGLHQRLSSTRAEADRLLLERQIKAVQKKINQLVYELYGLTNEEIKIIEES
jgi:peptidoglycan hydrolase CwlO-like protein